MKKSTLIILSASILLSSTKSALASPRHVLKQTGGVISGLFVGPFVGGARGFAVGAHNGTDAVAASLGDKNSSFARGVGAVSGGLLWGFAGGLAGAFKCGYNGVKYGIDNPYSNENYCLTGRSFTDFEVLK